MVFFENIKRMMGWCPNMNSMNNGKTLHFDEVVVNVSTSDDKSIHTTGRWLNKYRNRLLMKSLILTLLAIYLFISYGINKPDIFMAGMITGLVFSLATIMIEWQRLNETAAGKYKNLKIVWNKMFVRNLIVIGLIFVTLLTTMLATRYFITNFGFSNLHAFFSGAFLFVWVEYFEVAYWERKNQKMLIIRKRSFYAVDMEAGGAK